MKWLTFAVQTSFTALIAGFSPAPAPAASSGRGTVRSRLAPAGMDRLESRRMRRNTDKVRHSDFAAPDKAGHTLSGHLIDPIRFRILSIGCSTSIAENVPANSV